MNAKRRAQLARIVAALEVELSELEALRDDQRGAFDNLPEGLQATANGQKAEEDADALDTAYEELEAVVSNLNELAS